jgi:hypothetical protein
MKVTAIDEPRPAISRKGVIMPDISTQRKNRVMVRTTGLKK